MDAAEFDLSTFENIWSEIYQQYDWLMDADYLDKTNLLKVENFNLVGFFHCGRYFPDAALIDYHYGGALESDVI